MANDRFLSMFFEEARELLQALEAGLMDLEARRDDRAHLDRTFRAAHTLKGAAGMVGLRAIAGFTHGVEAVLDRIRSGTLGVRSEIITALLAAKDYLAAAVEAEEAGRPIEPPTGLEGRLEALLEGPGPATPAESPEPIDPGPSAATGPIPTRGYRVRFAPKSDLLRKGVSPLGILAELRELGDAEVVADWGRVPPLEDLDPRDCYLAWTVDLWTAADPARLDEVFLFLDDRGQLSITPLDADDTPDVPATATPAPPLPPATEPTTRPAPSARIRVEAEQLDLLVGMAGELAMLSDGLQGLRELDGIGPWLGSIEALERIARRLRDTTLELRMVPVEELFVRFPRLVRDLAERSGKLIALRIEGEDTRLDRAIIERLAEPMIHLIRNAVDHGLESPDERRAAGKPATGRITIGAEYAGDRVAIRVAEDGRGLDRARIVRKGVAAGLLPPDASPDDPRVVNVIFEPGFSTRDQVGELSGRGVGLDVVRDTIRALRGSLSVRSEAGQGTTFLLRLPLTLAMIDGLLVEADGARFVVPMGQVEECVAVAVDETMPAMGRLAAIVRGEYVPIVSLRGRGGVADGMRRELLLTRHAERRVAVAVDRLLGRVQAVIQPLDEGLGELRRFSGATILGDGSICLILDLATVVADARAVDFDSNANPVSC
ncbi:MAG TPA: chemotaxis protein CheA [Isosphaeraceae bacterium]|nr:chemotaxis protein CheA [Isosphaeraceae bacterium]